MTDNTFQLSGFVFPGINEDPFGLWDVVPAASGVSFGVVSRRVRRAGASRNFTTLLKAQPCWPHSSAPCRISKLPNADRAAFGGDRPIGRRCILRRPDRSTARICQPEQSLEAALQRLTAPVSYGLFDRKKQAEQEADLEATSQWRQFLEQAREMIAHYARVETEIAGKADRTDGGRVDRRLPHDLDTSRHRRRHAGASAQRRCDVAVAAGHAAFGRRRRGGRGQRRGETGCAGRATAGAAGRVELRQRRLERMAETASAETTMKSNDK